MDINKILQQNAEAVKMLLRRYRVLGDPNIETINAAHRTHGAAFMAELMTILTPSSSFTGLGGIIQPGGLVDSALQSQQQQNQQKGKFWIFWDNLLNRVDSTGKAIGQFKYDSAGNAIYQDASYIQQQQTQKMVLVIAGLIVVAIVAILIFKNKS